MKRKVAFGILLVFLVARTLFGSIASAAETVQETKISAIEAEIAE